MLLERIQTLVVFNGNFQEPHLSENLGVIVRDNKIQLRGQNWLVNAVVFRIDVVIEAPGAEWKNVRIKHMKQLKVAHVTRSGDGAAKAQVLIDGIQICGRH